MERSTNDNALSCFHLQLYDHWLPEYCNDPGRRYALAGYRRSDGHLAAVDASDFMYTLEAGVVFDTGGGRYRAPRSKAIEVIFWEGLRATVPRPITLWREPVITIASAGRLHRDHGWPVELLGLQSKNGAFDLVVYDDANCDRIAIAGEVKKSVPELSRMMDLLRQFAADPALVADARKGAAQNASRKWSALATARPPLFWAIGPGGHSELFSVAYDPAGPSKFTPRPVSELAYEAERP